MPRKKNQIGEAPRAVRGVSLDPALMVAFDKARASMRLDSSNFIRLCIVEKIRSMGFEIAEPSETNQTSSTKKSK